jgi:hypothetical protein
MDRTAIVARAAEMSDLDAIVRIDEKLSGHTRKDYWRQRLEIAALRPPCFHHGPMIQMERAINP